MAPITTVSTPVEFSIYTLERAREKCHKIGLDDLHVNTLRGFG